MLFPLAGWAAYTRTTDSHFFVVKYAVAGYLVSYPITITNYFIVDFTLSNNVYTNTTQGIGGVITNALRPGYYPFGQTIGSAWTKYYKFDTYNTQFNFSIGDPGIADEYDKPFGFVYGARNFYPGDRLDPYFKWVGNGTLPEWNTLETKSISF